MPKMYDFHWSNAKYMNPSRATIPLIRPHQCDSEGGRIRGVLLYGHVMIDEEHILWKVLRTDTPEKRKIGRPKTGWEDMRLEKYWNEIGRGDGQDNTEKEYHLSYRRPYAMGNAKEKKTLKINLIDHIQPINAHTFCGI